MRWQGLLLGLAIPLTQAAEPAPLTVRVNTQERGTFIVGVDESGACLSRAAATGIGLPASALPVGDAERGCWQAQDFGPAIAMQLDSGQALLDIRIDPHLLPANTVFLDGTEPAGPASYASAAYLNYAFDAARDGHGDTSWSAPLQLGARSGRWMIDALAIADEKRVERLSTSLRRDFPERLAALRFGDITPQNSSGLMGVQWARDFGYEPQRRISPGVDYVGVLETPSTVEVYVDERLVSTTQLPAGPIQLRDLPGLNSGAGSARIEIRDAFGQRRSELLDFYLSSGRLSAQESDFSIAAGLPRSSSINGLAYAAQLGASAFYRRGWSDALTAGGEFQFGEGVSLAGASSDLGLGTWGELAANARLDLATRGAPYAADLAYRYSRRRFSFDLGGSVRRAGFQTLGASARSGERVLRVRASAALLERSSASLSYTHSLRAGRPLRTVGLTVSQRLPRRLGSLNLQAQREAQSGQTLLIAFFSTAISSRAIAQASYSEALGQRETRAQILAAPRDFTGYGYRLETARDANDELLSRAELDARYTRGTVRIEQQAGADRERSRVLGAGSIAWADGTLALGQPVRGSFAIVDLGRVAGAEVLANGRLIGRSGRQPLLISELSPYRAQQIRVRLPEDAPMDVDLATESQAVVLADGAGQPVSFRARVLKIFEGRLLHEPLLEYRPVQVLREGAVVQESVLGERGYFYLEGLEPGRYELRVLGQPSCSAQLVLPDLLQTAISLGELPCGAPL